jgi:glyoxylase-like metal-dependent hydrolase (beta-lactamase superfamily II)
MRFDLSLKAHYGVAERLSPRIERLLAPNPGPFTFRGTGVYIVGAGDEVAVIDPGPDLPEHVAALRRAIGSRKVSHILVTHTHKDHSPAAAPLKAWSGARIHAFGPHAQGDDVEEGGDRIFVPDVRVKDGVRLAGRDFTLECVFTPGHTANHMCYALVEEKALFTGDHVMGWSTSVIAPPDGNMGDYMRSLEKLIARHDALLYPTHGSPIGRPKSFLRALLTHRRMREAQILRCLTDGADTAAVITARLYADVAPALHKAATLTVCAHLEKLAGDGRAVRQPDGRYRVPG